MNDEQPPVPEPALTQPPLAPLSQPQPKSPKRLLLVIVGLIIAGGIGSGVTYAVVRHNNTGAQTTQTQAAKNTTTSQANQNVSSSTSPAWHTVVFGDTSNTPNVATKLAFPQNYQAIAYINGPDGFRSLFGDNSGSFTYNGGQWKIGNPEDGSGAPAGEIEIMGIAPDWYTRNGYATFGGANGDAIASDPTGGTINGYNFYTAQQKNDSLKALVSDTSACAKDPTKGFSISGLFNVCYKPNLIKQAYAAYDPQVLLSGYASIKGVPYVLFGYVTIGGGLDGESPAQLDKAGNDFKAGNIAAPTQKKIDAFIAAFKNSTVTTK